MPEHAPNHPNFNTNKYYSAQAALQWMQQQLAEQGITASPEEAQELLLQKIIHDTKRWLQQNLADQGVDVSPDEADAINRFQFYHHLMKHSARLCTFPTQ